MYMVISFDFYKKRKRLLDYLQKNNAVTLLFSTLFSCFRERKNFFFFVVCFVYFRFGGKNMKEKERNNRRISTIQ